MPFQFFYLVRASCKFIAIELFMLDGFRWRYPSDAQLNLTGVGPLHVLDDGWLHDSRSRVASIHSTAVTRFSGTPFINSFNPVDINLRGTL